jgi:hypothetical protein
MKLQVLHIALACTLCVAGASAQVTIGANQEPEPGAILDIRTSNGNGGVLFPNVALTSLTALTPITGTAANLKGLVVYNTTENSANHLIKGLHVWDGARWSILNGDFFYLPPFNLPLTPKADNKTYDLYNEYQKQFTKAGNSQFVSSDASLPRVPGIYDASKFIYVVTKYDQKLISNVSIDPSGVLSYNVLETIPSDTSFMTVVMIPKPF